MDNYYGNKSGCNGIKHTIKKGDTLYLISRFYNIPIGEIMAANREVNIYNLQIGDELCIPLWVMRDNEMSDKEAVETSTEPMEEIGNNVSEASSYGDRKNLYDYEDYEDQEKDVLDKFLDMKISDLLLSGISFKKFIEIMNRIDKSIL